MLKRRNWLVFCASVMSWFAEKKATLTKGQVFLGLRSALQHQIRSPPLQQTDLDLIEGEKFQEANKILDAYLNSKHLVKDGQLCPRSMRSR